MENYPWAANNQKLLRSIAFVQQGTSGTNISKEQEEKMVKEYYVQIGGLVLMVDSTTEDTFKCDQCDFVARKEMGLKIHKGKEHKNETNTKTDSATDDIASTT